MVLLAAIESTEAGVFIDDDMTLTEPTLYSHKARLSIERLAVYLMEVSIVICSQVGAPDGVRTLGLTEERWALAGAAAAVYGSRDSPGYAPCMTRVQP